MAAGVNSEIAGTEQVQKIAARVVSSSTEQRLATTQEPQVRLDKSSFLYTNAPCLFGR